VVSATTSQSDSTWVRTRGLRIKSGHQAWNLTDLNKRHVAFGSWPCKNSIPGKPERRPGLGRSQAAIAAINGLVPTMFMTRVRL